MGFTVAFKDSLNGLAVNTFGPTSAYVNRLAATTDGGVTWTLRPRPFQAPSTALITYVPGSGGAYVITSWANIGLPVPTAPGSAYTMNNGDTWTIADNLPHGQAVFASPSTGWSAGNGDLIYRWTSPVLPVEPAVKQLSEIARAYRLEQNYPNPFNPATIIRFSIPAGVSGPVALRVYNVLGQEVTTLINDKLQPGSYETTFDAIGLASGAYFYRLTAGGFVQTKRLLLIR